MLRKYYLSTSALAFCFLVSNVNASQKAEEPEIRVSKLASNEVNKEGPSKPVASGEVKNKNSAVSNRFIRKDGFLEIQHFTSAKELLDIFYINRDITALNLNFTDLTDQVAGYLPTYCKALQSIDAGRTCLTDQGVITLIEAYKAQMISLDLSMVALTDLSLKGLAQHGKGLKSLKISHSPDITATGIRELLAGCTALNFLSLVECNVSDSLFTELRETYPNLVLENLAKTLVKNPNHNKAANSGKKKQSTKKKTARAKKNNKQSQDKKREELRKLLGPMLRNEASAVSVAEQPVRSSLSSNQTLAENLKKSETEFDVTILHAIRELENGRYNEGLFYYEKALSLINAQHPDYKECKTAYEKVKAILSSAGVIKKSTKADTNETEKTSPLKQTELDKTIAYAVLELEYERYDECIYYYEKALSMIDTQHPRYKECKAGYEQAKKMQSPPSK